MKRVGFQIPLIGSLVAVARIATAADLSPADLAFFENKVRPLLIENWSRPRLPDWLDGGATDVYGHVVKEILA